MAVKYIYTRKAKEPLDLLNHREQIERVIKDYFRANVFKTEITRDSISFTVHKSEKTGRMTGLGRKLRETLKSENKFIRQPQRVYAVFSNHDEEYVDIDLIDADFCDADVNEKQKIVTYSIEHEGLRDAGDPFLNQVRCLENYSFQLSKEKLSILFSLNREKIESQDYLDAVFELKIYHHRRENKQGYFDIKENEFPVDHLAVYDEHYWDYVDTIEIRKSSVKDKTKDPKVKENIANTVPKSVALPDITEEIVKNIIPEGKIECKFKVYDVGQGLTTSLSKGEDKMPFFYFDYGTNNARNKAVVPRMKENLPDIESALIVISHLHDDHYNCYNICSTAHKAIWAIPKQDIKLRLQRIIADIKSQNGEVYFYSSINMNDLSIQHSNISSISPLRLPKRDMYHEDGYAMYLHGDNCYVVVSGDQDYDYQETNRLTNIDILVACHHGGKYCWSKKGNVPSTLNKNSEIVYSYGQNNTYNHPSQKAVYHAAGWKKSHDTAVIGPYSKTVTVTLL